MKKKVPSIEKLEAKLETFQEGLGNAWDTIDALEAKLEEEREERRRLEEEVQDLQKEIDRLDARTDLLSLVENSDEMTAEQRRITLIQHLNKAAKKERERGRDAKASVTRDEAEAALQYPDLDRTTFFGDLRKAPDLVGNESVLSYESSSGGKSRLKLNLEKGDLPSDVVGHARRNGGE